MSLPEELATTPGKPEAFSHICIYIVSLSFSLFLSLSLSLSLSFSLSRSVSMQELGSQTLETCGLWSGLAAVAMTS